MRLSFVPLIAALLPAVAIHVSYVIAASHGHVPWCFPYIDSCTSISATGRQAPESFVFRAMMIPAAVVLMVYWTLSHAWLKSLGSVMTRTNRSMLVLGVVAALGLILYTTVLGTSGQIPFIQRRIGVTTFYIFSVVAQLLMTVQIVVLARRRPDAVSAGVRRALVATIGLVVFLGVFSLVLSATTEAYERVEDAFEWLITLPILCHLLLTYFAWRQSGFHARFGVTGEGPET